MFFFSVLCDNIVICPIIVNTFIYIERKRLRAYNFFLKILRLHLRIQPTSYTGAPAPPIPTEKSKKRRKKREKKNSTQNLK